MPMTERNDNAHERPWADRLDDLDPASRTEALSRLADLAQAGAIRLPPAGTDVNLHMHTFFSYNANGHSPSRLAWRARKAGLAAAGIVDFDVLDGLDEFFDAGRRLGLRSVAGMESRVFVPEFASRVLNSPGEPGIAYHLGVGFTHRPGSDDETALFLDRLKATAQQRNREIVERVNVFTDPVRIDIDTDVLPLTPSGNATERHLCLAYARRAACLHPNTGALKQFWTGLLGTEAADLDYPDGPKLQALIRAKTMKQGGTGYIRPDPKTFPDLADMNRFSLAMGALPAMTWLDGTSEGEHSLDEWLDVCMAHGVEAVNIVPDRNFSPGVQDDRLDRLRNLIAHAQERHLPLLTGTEMNSAGQKFVDAFDSAELAPYRTDFLNGALILFGHTVLQSAGGLGYASDWARSHFPKRAERNAFYARIGAEADPAWHPPRMTLHPDMSPDDTEQRIIKTA